MTIIDKDDCLTLNRVTLLLTMKEVKSLQLQLGDLISKPRVRDIHIGNMNSEGEISVAIYTESKQANAPALTPPSPSLVKRGIRGGVEGDGGFSDEK